MPLSLALASPDAAPAACEAVLRALPGHFGIESALRDYVAAAGRLPGWIATIDGDLAGYLAVERHRDWSLEIHVMGVLPACQGRGVGRALVAEAEALARAEGLPLMQVKTLGPSREDAGYAATRRFYAAVGFRPLQELALWGPDNPALVMVKGVR